LEEFFQSDSTLDRLYLSGLTLLTNICLKYLSNSELGMLYLFNTEHSESLWAKCVWFSSLCVEAVS